MVNVRSGIGIVTLLSAITAQLVLKSNAKPAVDKHSLSNTSARLTSRAFQGGSHTDPPFYTSWPALPLGGRIYRVHPNDSPRGFDQRELGLPEGDFVNCSPAIPRQLKGVLAYTIRCGNKYLYVFPNGRKSNIPNNDYLVMRRVNVNGKSIQDSSINYHFLAWSDLGGYRGIEFSPDGKSLVYGEGYTGRNDAFFPTSWRFDEGKLTSLIGIGNRFRYNISADGKSFAVLSFLDYQSNEESYMQPLTLAWTPSFSSKTDAFLEIRTAAKTSEFKSEEQRDNYWSSLSKYPDYDPNEEKDTHLKGYPFWRITNHASRRNVVWGSNKEVFYTHQPPVSSSVGRATNDNTSYPSVWSATLITKTNALVLERGYDPVPSPDDRYIAFFGWSLDEKPDAARPAMPPALWLFDRRLKTRKRLSDQNGGYVFWTHDSRRLICARFPSGQYHAQISMLSLDGQEKQLATVEARDPLNLGEGRQGPPAPISFKGISKNNRFLIADVCEFTGIQGSTYSTERALRAVDLTSGAISTLATAKPPTNTELQFSWDWFDISDYKPASKQ